MSRWLRLQGGEDRRDARHVAGERSARANISPKGCVGHIGPPYVEVCPYCDITFEIPATFVVATTMKLDTSNCEHAFMPMNSPTKVCLVIAGDIVIRNELRAEGELPLLLVATHDIVIDDAGSLAVIGGPTATPRARSSSTCTAAGGSGDANGAAGGAGGAFGSSGAMGYVVQQPGHGYRRSTATDDTSRRLSWRSGRRR